MTTMNEAIDWKQLLADCVSFTQRLIQTPSMPHEEAQIAQLILEEMRRLGFDEIELDGIGNVIGRIHGRDRSLPALVLNSHLDHVDPGDLQLWPVDPYAGAIVDGRLVGRGACDIKGPLAVQIYSMAALLRAGQRPRRDVVFTGVVQEEVGGAGATYWAEQCDYPVALVVLGEPSDNALALGHRGVVQMWVTFHGRSVHASVPERGVNPNYMLANLLQRLPDAVAALPAHPLLGATTVSPTIVEVDTRSGNVTPAWTRVLLDFRTARESLNSLQALVHGLVGDAPHTITDAWCSTPTLFADSDAPIFGFDTAPDSEVVVQARAALAAGMGREPALTSYRFATDGRLLAPFGMPIVGYSPAEEDQAHIAGESISIAKMEEALRGYVALLQTF